MKNIEISHTVKNVLVHDFVLNCANGLCLPIGVLHIQDLQNKPSHYYSIIGPNLDVRI